MAEPLQHLAVIMDGNGRWAKKRLLPRPAGHRAGMLALREIVRAADEAKIAALTVYALSTENWERPPAEVHALMRLLLEFCKTELPELHAKNVRVTMLGDHTRAPPEVQEALARAEDLTRANTGLRYNIAFGYGALAEATQAARELARAVQHGELAPEDITADTLHDRLYTAGLPPVDLLIRTGVEQRLSNFLLLQCAYAELYFTDTLWPDFTPERLHEALDEYARRARRFGKV